MEREHELAVLERAVARLRAGRGSFLLVESPAGTGKTALVDELCRRAAAAGCRVLAERAIELDATAPLGVTLRLLAQTGLVPVPLATAVDRLHTGAAAPEASVEAGAAFIHALAERVAALARQGPLTLVVDDAHWADPVALRWLVELVERTPHMPVLVAVALRGGEAPRRAVARLRAAGWSFTLSPAELSRTATSSLVRRRLTAATDGFVAACHKATNGNPLLLGELIADCAATGIPPDDRLAASLSELAPQTVIDGVLVRLGRLPVGAAELAVAVAVLGDGALLRHAAALAGCELSRAAEAADALVAAAIITGEGTLSYRHPLLAAAVLADVGPFRRAELHRRAAELLFAEGDADRAAAHLLRSSALGDAEVADRLRAAAHRASARGDAAASVRFLQRALHEPPPAPARAEVLVELAHAQTAAGDGEAIGNLETALTLLEDRGRRAEALTDLARLHHLRQDFGTAAGLAQRAMDELEPDDPRFERAAATWHLAAGFHPETCAAARARVATLAARHEAGDTPDAPELLAVLALTAVARFAEPDEIAALARRAIVGQLESSVDGPWFALDYAAGPLRCTGHLAELERLTGRAVEAATHRGSLLAAASAAVWRGEARLRLGDLAGAVADAEIGLRPHRYGWRHHTPQSAALLARVRLEHGDVAGARAAIDLAAGTSVPHPPHRYAEGLVLLAEGDPEAAVGLLHRTGQELAASWGCDTPVVVPWRSAAAMASLALDDRWGARRLAEEELVLARRAGVPASIALALRALAAATGGEREVELLDRALALLSRTEETLETVRTRVAFGSALRRAGQRRAARVELAVAHDQAERLGARVLAERAAEEQLASGARPRRIPVTGPASLTPSERRIAERAAAGASNRQIATDLFLAQKTVEWHLGNVYRKLEVSSRRELASLLACPA